MSKLINILIRHKEGREKEFERCMQSIYSQTYQNYLAIVHADCYEAYEDGIKQNLRKNEDKTEYISKSFTIKSGAKAHYNLYCNYLKESVTDGWFFYMDDDDYLASPTVLEELSHHLFDGALIVQFLRNKKIKKPTDKMIANKIIKRGMIGGGCLVLHHSFAGVADWKAKPAADYDWIKEVTDKVPTRFVPLVLQVTDNNGRHGK